MQKRFAADPIVGAVLPLLGAESFFDDGDAARAARPTAPGRAG